MGNGVGSEHDVHHHGPGGAEVDPGEGGGGGVRQQEPRHRVRGPTAHEAGEGKDACHGKGIIVEQCILS